MPLIDDNTALIFTSRSRIGNVVPDCTIEETYDDRLQITTHPVEKGANVSDHAFLLPKGIEMRIGWADYKGGNVKWSSDNYEKLRSLQASLEPIDVSSGKRLYRNMLIQSIAVTNDQKMKHAVVATVRLIEVRFAGAVDNLQSAPPASSQTAPQTTQPALQQGPVQPVPSGTTATTPPPGTPPDATEAVMGPPIPSDLVGPPQPPPEEPPNP